MKILFIGIHNKPGMKPLDSKTATGSVIDKIIALLPAKCECIKTNLSEEHCRPVMFEEINEQIENWHQKYPTRKDDVVVYLGSWVANTFINVNNCRTVKLRHPSPMFRNVPEQIFAEEAAAQINKILNQ